MKLKKGFFFLRKKIYIPVLGFSHLNNNTLNSTGGAHHCKKNSWYRDGRGRIPKSLMGGDVCFTRRRNPPNNALQNISINEPFGRTEFIHREIEMELTYPDF
ncbi:hypothetical protein OIU79_016479 [Salix purpurea]|uniref:Uncharacterized protein n=1 Tax=Salix purpurea TaxID=77065 RepID=A0A9Q0PEG9_SALPP|nr:hypothetical protein OIU79_016479 [Salix purpurea]